MAIRAPDGANKYQISILEIDKLFQNFYQYSFFRFSEKWVEPWRTELSSGLTTFGKTRSILHAQCALHIKKDSHIQIT